MLEGVNRPRTRDVVAERLTDYVSSRLAAAGEELQRHVDSHQERLEGESCR